LPIAFCLVAAGCHSSNDLLEAELRTREMQLLDLRTERDHLVSHNDALQREIVALRGGSPMKLSPEEASQTFTLHGIALGRQTGGLDEDGRPGDEALQVLVEPRDVDGHPIKVPGKLVVQALEITPQGTKNPLSSCEIPPDALRRSWKSGLFTTGYLLNLPWKNWPTQDKMKVIAQLTLSDGRTFEAEKDITVRVAPAAIRKPAPEPDGPALPLPPPRKVMWWKADPAHDNATEPASFVQPQPARPLIDAVKMGEPVPLP